MTRPEALEELIRLAHGLLPDEVGVRRLLERVAAGDDPELLRAALAEEGARRVLEGLAR